MTHTFTDNNFDVETSSGLVLIDFWATWCGPCQIQGPIIEQLANELSEQEMKIGKLDVDANPNTAQKYGILSIPTLLFMNDGEIVKQVSGIHTKSQLLSIVNELS
ncbi:MULTISPECIES: thioredoxin [unclassified Lactococcus]|uniref:thioredoxin n=1 Tax=unclassified Lactococcus TaxID=2643510 RepID=UPI0011C84FDA|nr:MULTISPECIES: thioredoxin [unclassified Lactococcus]MQW23978.1 thioredoxin [Lactococcus sp. dk101]TXK36920.1 thioredoxin [Lactococcus sp. dk310]TXK47097.1 thioredoxin [Lactococcus sp. dk322]